MEKDTFIFKKSWRDALVGCTAEVRLEVYDALIEYAISGTLSELKPLAQIAFQFIKNDIDICNIKYQQILAKRRAAGQKGGFSKSKQMLANGSKTKQNVANVANAKFANEDTENQDVTNVVIDDVAKTDETSAIVSIDTDDSELVSIKTITLKTNTSKEKENTKEKESEISFDAFWDLYDKKVGDKAKLKKKWDKLSKKDKALAMEYIPKYISAQPNKQYRKNPETFINNSAWNDEIISESVIPNNKFYNTEQVYTNTID